MRFKEFVNVIATIVGIFTVILTLLKDFNKIYQYSIILILIIFISGLIWIKNRTERVDTIEQEIKQIKRENKNLKNEVKNKNILDEHSIDIMIIKERINNIIEMQKFLNKIILNTNRGDSQ